MKARFGFAPTLLMAALMSILTVTLSEGADLSPRQWQIYSFQKPPGFDSLAAFVVENYGDAVDQTTLSSTTIDGRPAVAFWSTDQSARQFNILFQDSESTWVLMTTAKLEFVRDVSDTTPPTSTTAMSASGSLKPESITMQPPFSSPCFTSANACNCVFYARCLAPWLNPKHIDLTTFAAKKSLINTQTPSMGAVAVIQVSGMYSFNGHLAVVIAINRNGAGQVTTVEITEANYNPCSFDVRTDTPANLHIVGYIIP